MPVSFEQIPANWRMPLFWAEIDPSMAGLPIIRQPILLCGSMVTKTDAVGSQDYGDAVPDVPKPIGTQTDANVAFGQGSELAGMFRAAFANNFAQEIWAAPVAPLVASTAAHATITITTPPTDAGVISLYIGGYYVAVAVGTTDTPTTIAAALAAAINADLDLPVMATASTGTVNLTCKTKGVNGNDITLQLNFYGKVGGQEIPPGLVMTVPATLTGGAGVPNYANLIANLGENQYEYVAIANNDAQTLFEFEQEWGFSDTGRWGWMRQLYGHLFLAKRDTYANLITFGTTRNFGPTSIMAVEVGAAAPTYEWAAAYASKSGRALVDDPARPLQTLTLTSILPCQPEDAFILSELNSLSGVGLATQKTGPDGTPQIMRDTTTAQFNKYGQSDDAYELITTMATLARLIRNQRQVITSKYPRTKLADNGTRYGPGQKIVTPNVVKAELVSQYSIDEFNGLVENITAFKSTLIVERDPNNPNRLNVLYGPDLVNQLRIYAVLVQFRLQYNRGLDQEIAA